MIYFEAALEGDAWFMPDVIGVYRMGHACLSHGGHKRSAAGEKIHYVVERENARRSRHIKEKLYGMTDKKTADNWYISKTLSMIRYYAIARPGIKDRLKTLCIMLSD